MEVGGGRLEREKVDVGRQPVVDGAPEGRGIDPLREPQVGGLGEGVHPGVGPPRPP